MTLREIAFRHLLRRKGKAALVLFGLVVGVATVVSVTTFADTVAGDVLHKLEKYGANILVVPRTETLPLSYGGITLGGVSFDMKEIRQADLEAVRHIENAANIAALGPMILDVVEVGGRQAMMAGVEFGEYRILKPWWKIDGEPPAGDGLLAGAEAARLLDLAPGGETTVNGRPFRVTGVLAPTGSQDDQLLFTRLETAQALLGKPGRVSLVEVAALCTACPITEMVRQISAALPDAKVMAIQQVVAGRMETLAHFRSFAFGVSVLVILVGSLVVLVTMTAGVRERKAEIGVFRAIGFRKRHVMTVVLLEAAMVSVLAGVMGYLAGLGATRVALALFGDNAGAHMVFRPELAAGALLVAVATGLAAAFYPALVASRMDPNEALRSL